MVISFDSCHVNTQTHIAERPQYRDHRVDGNNRLCVVYQWLSSHRFWLAISIINPAHLLAAFIGPSRHGEHNVSCSCRYVTSFALSPDAVRTGAWICWRVSRGRQVDYGDHNDITDDADTTCRSLSDVHGPRSVQKDRPSRPCRV